MPSFYIIKRENMKRKAGEIIDKFCIYNGVTCIIKKKDENNVELINPAGVVVAVISNEEEVEYLEMIIE